MHHATDAGSSYTSMSMGGRWGEGGIDSAKMPAFALPDKSRLTQLIHECTFHIFYQLSRNKALHTLLNSFGNSKLSAQMHHATAVGLSCTSTSMGVIESSKILVFALDKSGLT